MSLVGFKGTNHPQQVGKRGAVDATDDRGTLPEFISECEAEFGTFTLDAAASPENAKAPAYYTREDNGLLMPWSGRVWCNPPYSGLADWVIKAWREWEAGSVESIVMLLPANRTEQSWWQEHVEPVRDSPSSPLRTRFLKGRMRFVRPNSIVGPKGDRPPFGCVLLMWVKDGES